MIDLKTLKELVKLMSANGLTKLDLQDPKGERVTLERSAPVVAAIAPAVQQVVAAPQAVAPAAPPASGASATKSDADAGLVPIPSPMVGTFYVASGPDAKAFVSVGDKIGPESVVCIIEAMKVFNEIKAETAGTIQKILVANGQAVEFGQPLFLVKP